MKEGSKSRRYAIYAAIIIVAYLVRGFIYAVIATIIAILGLATALFVLFYIFWPEGDIRGNKFLRSLTRLLKKLRKN
ncbi:MAG TPA: hypothetical protein EYO86_03170 [Pelagibacterales bacterium]|nr:hypothetical protein [Pelagibacterales bacterium]